MALALSATLLPVAFTPLSPAPCGGRTLQQRPCSSSESHVQRHERSILPAPGTGSPSTATHLRTVVKQTKHANYRVCLGGREQQSTWAATAGTQ